MITRLWSNRCYFLLFLSLFVSLTNKELSGVGDGSILTVKMAIFFTSA